MENELNTQFVCAFHETNDKELEIEKNMIKKYNPQDDCLNLTFKKKFNFASDGGLQGVCLAGNDVIGAFKRSETNTDVEILDKTSYELRKTLSGLNLGHANDCAYNFNTGDIIFAATGNTIKKLKYDSSYNLTKEEVVTVSSTSGVSAIAYDGDRDQYIVYRNICVFSYNYELINLN